MHRVYLTKKGITYSLLAIQSSRIQEKGEERKTRGNINRQKIISKGAGLRTRNKPKGTYVFLFSCGFTKYSKWEREVSRNTGHGCV